MIFGFFSSLFDDILHDIALDYPEIVIKMENLMKEAHKLRKWINLKYLF